MIQSQPRPWKGEDLFEPAASLTPEDERLIEAYTRAGRTLDDLPYTPEMDAILEAAGRQDDPRAVFDRLLTLRKSAHLPRLGRSLSQPARLDPHDAILLADLVAESVGSVGRRDRLPYTQEFDSLVARFNQESGRSLDHHAVWRLVARIAK